MMLRFAAVLLTTTALGGCTRLHMQYDFGRAYVGTLRLQSDLTRPSSLDDAYQLYGTEAIRIRINVQESTANTESGEQTVE